MAANPPIRLLLAGEGAIAALHMQALQTLEGAEVVCLAGGVAADSAAFAERGPFGGFYRYIGEEATLHAYRDELKDHEGIVQPVPAGTGFARQDGEFLAAIRERRTPESSFAACLPTMRLLDRLDRLMGLT